MKFPFRIERVRKSPVDQKTTPFSALALTTPRGRRRASLLVILVGLTVSHVYQSDMVGDLFNQVRQETTSLVDRTLPTDVPWVITGP